MSAPSMQPLQSDDLVRRRPEESAIEIGGRWVVMGVEQGAYVELNAVGRAIWDRIAEERGVASLAEEIAEGFDAPLAVVMSDILGFLAQLRDQKLITVRRPD